MESLFFLFFFWLDDIIDDGMETRGSHAYVLDKPRVVCPIEAGGLHGRWRE